MHGASDLDDALIAAALTKVALCGDCIARKVGVPVSRLNGTLDRLTLSVKVTNGVARCDACLKQTVVHRLG
jgi:hypothetical protein